MLMATGDAFPAAVDAVLPFILQEPTSQGTTVFSLREADQLLYQLAPRKLLDVVEALVGDGEPGSVYGLRQVLKRLVEVDATIVGSPIRAVAASRLPRGLNRRNSSICVNQGPPKRSASCAPPAFSLDHLGLGPHLADCVDLVGG